MRRRLAVLLAAAIAASGLVTFLIASPAQASVLGPFEIVSEDTGGVPYAQRCFDIPNWSQANGARLQLYHCRPSGYVQSNQSFFLYSTNTPNVWFIKPAHSAKCLDIKDYATWAGGVVQQWDCTTAYNQAFELAWMDSSRFWIHPLTASWPDVWCLKIYGATGDGASIIQDTCTTNANNIWRLNPV